MPETPIESATSTKTSTVNRASGIMVTSQLASRILGILRETVMAHQFGLTGLTDAYVLAFSVPDLLFFLVSGGALSSAFIPVFSEYFHTDREDEAWEVFSTVTTVMSIGLLIAVSLTWIFATPLAHLVASGKSEELIPLIARMSRILVPAQFAFFIGGLMFGTLYSRDQPKVPALAPNIYNVGIIFGAIVLAHFFQPGIVGMAYGALCGALIGNLIVPLFAMLKAGSRFHISFNVRHPGVKKVFRLMLPVVLGLSLPGVYAIIMRNFGSYYPEGVNTALDQSNKLMQAPLGIFGQSLAIAVFPTLTQFFAQQKMDQFRDQIERTMRTVIYITTPISAIMFVLAPDIIAALLQYGKFTAANTEAVADCLRLFCFGIPAWCLHPVMMRGFFALQNTVKPIVIGTITTFVFLGLCFGLKATPLGHLGLPLASSISAYVLVGMMFAVLGKDAGGMKLNGILMTLGKAITAALLTGFVVWGLTHLIPSGTTGSGRNLLAFARMLLLGTLGAWTYYFATKQLGMSESKYFDKVLAKFSRG